MRVLITGSRNWENRAMIEKAILKTVGLEKDVTIVHGAAPGADSIADNIATKWGYNAEVHPAQWGKYGRAAGPKRNQEMVDLGADVVLAFMMPGSRGTADCVRRAKKAGLHVIEYHATLEPDSDDGRDINDKA